jgi:hypothetical protein
MMIDGSAFLSDLATLAGLGTKSRILDACFFILFFPLAIENYSRIKTENGNVIAVQYSEQRGVTTGARTCVTPGIDLGRNCAWRCAHR